VSSEELDKFVSDFDKKQIEYFKELEEAIEEVDLSKETKEHLIDLMYKDENMTFGFVEQKCASYCRLKGSDKE
jgi:hypothetical protein